MGSSEGDNSLEQIVVSYWRCIGEGCGLPRELVPDHIIVFALHFSECNGFCVSAQALEQETAEPQACGPAKRRFAQRIVAAGEGQRFDAYRFVLHFLQQFLSEL